MAREGAEIIHGQLRRIRFLAASPPTRQTAEVLSKALGSRTVMSGYITQGEKRSQARRLQMMERPLMTPDELKSIPKGHFIVMKTGTHPMRTRLRLFLEWGITFGDPYQHPGENGPSRCLCQQAGAGACHHAPPSRADACRQAARRRHPARRQRGEKPCPNPGQPGDEPPDGQKSLRP